MSTRASVVSVLLVLSLFGALSSGKTVFYSLSYLWGGLLLVSFIWSRLALRGLEFRREPRSLRSQVGHIFTEWVALLNKSRLTKLWVEVRDESDLPGRLASALLLTSGIRDISKAPGHRVSAIVPNLRPGREEGWLVRTVCTRRGRYHLGPAWLCSGDPFGLFPVSRKIPVGQHLVVLPVTVPVRDFPIPSSRLPGGEALRQRTHQVTPNASSVRDYAPGDGFNRIHWRSTARRQRLIVKEFEIDPMAEVWIVLDAAHRSQFWLPEDQVEIRPKRSAIADPTDIPLPPSTIEYGVAAAASLAFYLMQLDRAVGMITYGQARHVFQADKGESQLNRILESLAVVEAKGRLGLDQLLKVELARIPQGSSVVLITPDVSTHVVEAARRLKTLGRSPVLVLMDAESFGGPPGTDRVAQDVRQGGIPVRVLHRGEPLDIALSTTHRRRSIPVAA